MRRLVFLYHYSPHRLLTSFLPSFLPFVSAFTQSLIQLSWASRVLLGTFYLFSYLCDFIETLTIFAIA